MKLKISPPSLPPSLPPSYLRLLGPWSLVGVTFIYLAFVYYIESVDKFLHTVNHVIGEEEWKGGKVKGGKHHD